MSVEAMAPVAIPIVAPDLDGVARSTPAEGFVGLVVSGLKEVNRQLTASQVDLQKLAVGDAASLHQVMVGLEEARLSFQLLMQVRSRLLEAYQDVTRMQV
jgi:flagellar hook-basal body complex protein FliE